MATVGRWLLRLGWSDTACLPGSLIVRLISQREGIAVEQCTRIILLQEWPIDQPGAVVDRSRRVIGFCARKKRLRHFVQAERVFAKGDAEALRGRLLIKNAWSPGHARRQ